MDADDAATGKAARRGGVTPFPRLDIAGFWDSSRAANGADASAVGSLELEGMPLPDPRAPSLISGAAVRLLVVPLLALLGRLGLEGMHPPALKAPTVTLCAAV